MRKVGDSADLDTAQLRETAQIVSAQLDGKLDAQDEDIVQVEVEEFMSNIETVRAAVETHMEQNVMLLCQILGEEENERVSLNVMLTVQNRSNTAAARSFDTSSSSPGSSDRGRRGKVAAECQAHRASEHTDSAPQDQCTTAADGDSNTGAGDAWQCRTPHSGASGTSCDGRTRLGKATAGGEEDGGGAGL